MNKNNIKITLDEIRKLVFDICIKHGCDQVNANALSNTIIRLKKMVLVLMVYLDYQVILLP